MKVFDDNNDRRKMSGDVDNLKTFMDGKFDLLNNRIDTMCKRMEEHHNDLYGKDSDTPGIKTKVDRLDQHKKNADKHIMVVYSTAIALIFKTLADWFSGHK